MKERAALQLALKSRLELLRIRHPSYSLRAFAKRAGISPTTMSLIIKGKRAVSQKLAEELSDRLSFDPQERSEVLAPALESKIEAKHEAYIQISVDQYRIISDWRAFAILSLVKTENFKSDHNWVAERLGICVQEVDEAIERLIRTGMLTKIDGQYKRSISKYRTTEDIANASLQKSHAQTLDLAQRSLENDLVEDRDFTWLTLPMDTEKMRLAKTMIRKFQDDLSASLETDSKPREVYRLAIQFFPLTKIRSKDKK